MKIKLIFSLFIAALLMVGSPFLSEAEASSVPFTTGDGEWDGSFWTGVESDVSVGITDWGSQDRLQVRLCNLSSGGCTAYKTIENTPYGNTATFTNLIPGDYRGDVIKLDNPGNQVSGIIGFSFLNAN